MKRVTAVSDIDVRIGQAILRLRRRQGLTQKDLARHLGITFQQIQKYECAGNRISASRLYQIAQVLDIPIGAMFAEAAITDTANSRQMKALVTIVNDLPDGDKKIIFCMANRLKKYSRAGQAVGYCP